MTDLAQRKAQVRRFHHEVLCDAHDTAAIPTVLHEDVVFRGSLGDEKVGHAGFAQYVDSVHGALDGYRCTIRDLVAEDDQVFARMLFAGVHAGELMGFPATGERVQWDGCALFTFRAERSARVWVLGDLESLQEQLQASAR